MSHLLDAALTANDLRLAQAMYPTLDRSLRVNRGPASPVRGSSMDAVIAALGEGVGRVEVSEEQWLAFAVARNVDKGPKLARANDEHALNLQIQMQGAIGALPR